MTVIEGSTRVDGHLQLHGALDCPYVQKRVSAVHCDEYICEHFEAKQVKKGGLLKVWCAYSPPKYEGGKA